MSHPPLDDTSPLSDPANCGQAPPGPGATPLRLRCPHCHNPLQLADDRTDEVLCPACGSSFRVPDARQTSTTSGTRQLGKFLLLERVGAGAFGAVWKARDTELDRTVALKIPHAGLLSDSSDRERFQREARAAAQLRHPGIVAVHEVATLDDGLPALVADFVEGVTLRDYLQQRWLTFRESAELLAEVAEAVHYAHERGLVHRDLKPGNLMLEFAASVPPSPPRGRGVGGEGAPLPRPLVMDFGLALRPETDITLTVEGQVIGTPAYMSPEQARGQGHTVDRRSDVYCLGVILYELLTGELPFRGSKQMILHEVLHEEPPAPRRLNDKVPRDLETICLRCLEKEPGRRYSTAQALADDLRRWLKGEPIVARPAGVLERAWKWAKRRPAAAGLLAAGLLATMALVGLAVALAYQGRLEEAHRGEQEQRKTAEAFGIEADNQRKVAVDALGKAKAFGIEADNQRGRAERSEALVRRLLYFSEMNLARRFWDENDVPRMLELLEKYRTGPESQEDLRGFEWHYLWRLAHGDLLTFEGHDHFVVSVTFSPDGKWIASGGDQTVRVWDAQTGQELRTLRGHTAAVLSVAFSPDGKQIASGSHDRTVKVWDAATGQEAFTLRGHTDRVSSVVFSADSKRIVSASGDRTVKVWDATTRQEALTFKGHTDMVLSAAFSPEGTRIVSGGRDGTVRVWDAATGQELRALQGRHAEVLSVAFSPDGKYIASAGGDWVRVWDAETGQVVRTLGERPHTIPSVTFSADSKRIASGSYDRMVRIWDVDTEREVRTLKGHTNYVLSVAFSPDGARIASGGRDGTVRVWDATISPKLRAVKIRHTDSALSVAFSPDGTRIASAGDDKTVRIWDAATGREVRALQGHTAEVLSVTFSPDGKCIASGGDDQTVRVWDAQTGQELRAFQGHTARVRSVAFSPDGKTLASGGFDKTIRLWDLKTGKERALLEHTDDVLSVVFSPDGKWIASGGNDQTVRIWDAQTGQELRALRGHVEDGGIVVMGAVTSVAFSPDGKYIASGSLDRTVRVWDIATGQWVRVLKGHVGGVSGVAFSPDGTRIVSASHDRTVRVWDAATGQEALTLQGHIHWVLCVAFGRDGRRLASGSLDGTVRIWDATPPASKPAAPK